MGIPVCGLFIPRTQCSLPHFGQMGNLSNLADNPFSKLVSDLQENMFTR